MGEFSTSLHIRTEHNRGLVHCCGSRHKLRRSVDCGGYHVTMPSYQTLMLPLLRLAAKGEVALQDAVETLAKEFQLTPEEAAQRLPGGQRVIYNRTGWAKTELVKAGLIEQPKRGLFTITQRGRDLLSVRRQDFWDSRPRNLRETLAQLVSDVMRSERDAASVDWRWCGV